MTETKQIGKDSFNLYFQRDKGTIIPKFIRLSIRKYNLGVFTKRLNFGRAYGFSGYKGIEFFSNNYSFGISYKPTLRIRYSGSYAEPYTTTIIHFGFFFLSYRTSDNSKIKLEEKSRKEWEKFGDIECYI